MGRGGETESRFRSGCQHLARYKCAGFKVSKNVFSGKVIATYEIKFSVTVLSLMGNAMPPEIVGSDAAVASLAVTLPSPRITVTSVDKQTGSAAPLPEAEFGRIGRKRE
ncbi:MAG: hypothetical protein R2795_14135 [Saprospiraceae bacterium]